MKRFTAAVLTLFLLSAINGPPLQAACCYFSAQGKDVQQPAQKAFITWDPDKRLESFTVQPKFEGNAADFGMVIPTPGQPKLDEMPRDFFKELAVFTILEPMDLDKYKNLYLQRRLGAASAPNAGFDTKKSTVRVLESGIVGSLDYKIIQADKPDDLYYWLKANKYNYGGDQATLDFYIKKKWFFTVMKIDAKQMKPKEGGAFEGDVTPTRFTFTSDQLIYPLKITQISVKDQTEALFYVQSKQKMDLPGDFSYQFTFLPMWQQALSFAIPEKVTAQEKDWQQHIQPQMNGYLKRVQNINQQHSKPATLEWAKKITADDIAVLSGNKLYNRQAPAEDVGKLKLLLGHVQQGLFITKIRKVFTKDEMSDDLMFVRANVAQRNDDIEYFSILPTSPP